MTDDTQAIAARLKDIGERLDYAKRDRFHRYGADGTPERMHQDLAFASAHVETLTQEVAELERKETGYKVAIENLKQSIRALGDQVNKDGAELEPLRSRFEAKTDTNLPQKQLDIERQTNARLTSEIIEAIEEMPACRRQHLLDAPLLAVVKETERHKFWQQSRAEEAEQQRDAALQEVARLEQAVKSSHAISSQFGEQRDAAHAALKKYGCHTANCAVVAWLDAQPLILPKERPACTCGLDAALAASAPQKEEKRAKSLPALRSGTSRAVSLSSTAATG